MKRLLLCLLLIPASSLGLEIWVPDDHPSIQAAMDAAAAGDTVVLRCGTYHERDIQYKPDTTLRSETGDPTCVTIDAGDKGRCLFIDYVFPSDPIEAHVEGITFTGGSAKTGEFHWGGAVYCDDNGSYDFKHCIFENNHAIAGGAVSVNWASRAEFHDCEFTDNTANSGGAVMGSEGSLLFLQCHFEQNTATYHGGAVSVSRGYYGGLVGAHETLFRENQAEFAGGAIHVYQGYLHRNPTGPEWRPAGRSDWDVVKDCQFFGNSADDGGAVYTFYGIHQFKNCHFQTNSGFDGSAIRADFYATAQSRDEGAIDGCTFLNNVGSQGSLLFFGGETISLPIVNCLLVGNQQELVAIDPFMGIPTFHCCDIWDNLEGDWTGIIADQFGVEGNISEDPRFCPGNGPEEAWLRADSPCAAANNPECGLIGAWDVDCTATQPTSWSQIKTLY